jgi:hypothetical protein
MLCERSHCNNNPAINPDRVAMTVAVPPYKPSAPLALVVEVGEELEVLVEDPLNDMVLVVFPFAAACVGVS